MLKLDYPLEKGFVVTQKLNENLNSYYAEDKLTGHTGVDMSKGHREPIYAVCDSFCYLTTPSEDPMRYTAVYTIVEDSGVWYEISYGHCDSILASIGDLKKGQVIATQGNKGDVASNGVKVTREMKLAGSTAGTHLHFQVRLILPVEKKNSKAYYINNGGKIQGKYFEIPLYKNGIKGCINPLSMFSGKYPKEKVLKVERTLRYGDRGEDVKILQKSLNIKADGVFGTQTLKAVKDFQKANKLVVDGIVGIKTRTKLI